MDYLPLLLYFTSNVHVIFMQCMTSRFTQPANDKSKYPSLQQVDLKRFLLDYSIYSSPLRIV